MFLKFVTLLTLVSSLHGSIEPTFKESLHIQPLSKRYSALTFKFETIDKYPIEGEGISSYNLIRRSIAQIISKYNVTELSLAFTRGRWGFERFGKPMKFHAISNSGVEVNTWFHSSQPNFDQNWSDTTSALSGMFCTSLQKVSSPLVSTRPNFSFNRTTESPKFNYEDSRFVHLAEDICTENLTPWVKLLPCRGQFGIASLLIAKVIYDTTYHTMSLKTEPICLRENCKTLKDYHIKMEQTLTIVLDTIYKYNKYGWNLEEIFGKEINSTCPLASESKIIVHPYLKKKDNSCPKLRNLPFKLENLPKQAKSFTGCDEITFDLKEEKPKVVLSWDTKSSDPIYPDDKIKLERRITDLNNLHGEFEIQISNLSDETIEGAYLQNLPWILQPYLHTLRMSINNRVFKEVDAQLISQTSEKKTGILELSYQPAKDHLRGSSMEIKLRLKPKSSLTLKLKFVAKFLSLSQYHPDSQRGFSISSGIFSIFPKVTNVQDGQTRYYTTNLILSWPTPDFSMPYNVCALTCSMLGLYFSTFFQSFDKEFKLVEKE